MCAENVLRLSWIDWLSPMSASTWSKIGNSASEHGTGSPDCAISASRPDRLHGDGLAAGVRAADEQGAAFVLERQRHRHHRLASAGAARLRAADAAPPSAAGAASRPG